MSGMFFVELYEEDGDHLQYMGIYFEAGHVGNVAPVVGDCLIAPLHKADFKSPRDPKVHYAYDVLQRYCVPEVADDPSPRYKLIVKRRELTPAEWCLLGSKHRKDETL